MYRVIFTNPFVLIFTIGTILSFLIKHFLEFSDFKARQKNGGKLPEELKNLKEAEVFDTEKLSKITDYENAKYRAWIPSSIIGLILTLGLALSGFYPWIFNVVCRVTEMPESFGNTYSFLLLFMILVSIPESIVSIPFDLYEEFHVEKKFGFSNMTLKLWITDQIKEIFVSILLLAVLGAAMTGVLILFPRTWWLFLVCVLFVFTMIMQILYPLVIAPLFNKFTPLEDGELKTRITKLMENLGFKSTGIFVVDASKRSGHSNAYFTGIGKSKRVVLYDTLTKQLTTDELEAVLGHEFGHYKLHHIIRRLCVSIPVEILLMFILYLVSQSVSLYKGFGFAVSPENIQNLQIIGLFLSAMIAGSLSELVSPVTNISSRRDEYQADAFSAKLTKNPDALISGLVKLNSENLSELLPSKIYVFWNYSHPTLINRIRALKSMKLK